MNHRGFTLIELLVAISILGVLTTIGLVTYKNAQISARDQRRKQDLALIQQALELYYQVNKSYPYLYGCPTSPPSFACNPTTVANSMNSNWNYSATSGWIRGLSPNFMTTIPVDPINQHGDWFDSFQYYAYKSDLYSGCKPGQWYALYVNLENHSDRDNVQHKPVKWCDGTLLNGTGTAKIYPYTYLIVINKAQ